ncbi:DUF4365 domain-containing protein [Cohnella cholangitidis]|uniref:DUF4365 domain-containing protein n=1 Tax=Cohnella cholangitidis TaxID=2598458 RepID=A0A7G5BSY1_9BACL|nr:DUF4365 domain-containing protein [Cohnella cholangitidis]QMV40065.1 DUF4365 domain-containing protein [Cohnella cholangitidis]
MPNMDWSVLNHLQIGKYAEYFAKMEFTSYGFEVFTSEVDDRGIDFIVKDRRGQFCEIQVKALRGYGYVFAQKSKFNINNDNLYMTLLVFREGQMPDLFLIPSNVWRLPNNIFVDRNYDKPDLKSNPEYGINISKKNYDFLYQYEFKKSILLNMKYSFEATDIL